MSHSIVNYGAFHIILTDKTDGDFRRFPFGLSNTDQKKMDGLLLSFDIGQVSVLYPKGKYIKHSDGCEQIIHGQGVISKKNQSHTWAIPSADCVPLIITDPVTKAVGLLHLGWSEIYSNLVGTYFKEWFLTYPNSLTSVQIFLGPHICKDCFTLRNPKGWVRIVLFKLSRLRKFVQKNKTGYTFDITSAAMSQLAKVGFSKFQIQVSKECIFENEHLASCRREGVGRMSSNFLFVKVV